MGARVIVEKRNNPQTVIILTEHEVGILKALFLNTYERNLNRMSFLGGGEDHISEISAFTLKLFGELNK